MHSVLLSSFLLISSVALAQTSQTDSSNSTKDLQNHKLVQRNLSGKDSLVNAILPSNVLIKTEEMDYLLGERKKKSLELKKKSEN